MNGIVQSEQLNRFSAETTSFKLLKACSNSSSVHVMLLPFGPPDASVQGASMCELAKVLDHTDE